MNLQSQIELIDALIEEKEDYTIKYFLELKKEIESIEETELYAKNKNIRASAG